MVINAKIKSLIGVVLSPVRPRFNDSWLYQFYVNVQFPDYAHQKRREEAFYQSLFGASRPRLVFDVGANGGAKAWVFASMADKVICIEPDPDAVAYLRQRYRNNPRIIIVPKGVGAREGSAPFFVFNKGDCYNTFSDKWVKLLSDRSESLDRPIKTVTSSLNVEITTLDRLIMEHGIPDYIKLDVEGYELDAILGLTTKISLLSFECNLPEFRNDAIAIIHHLSAGVPHISFNLTTIEPPFQLQLQDWVDGNEIVELLTHLPSSYCEIYMRSNR
jgi:FkbM family methyltransferase